MRVGPWCDDLKSPHMTRLHDSSLSTQQDRMVLPLFLASKKSKGSQGEGITLQVLGAGRQVTPRVLKGASPQAL